MAVIARMRRLLPLAVVISVVMTLLLPVGGVASATSTDDAPPASRDLFALTDFYDVPDTLPPANGDIVRSEPMTFYLDPLRTVRAPATAHRIMYRSTDRQGEPIAVTGTVLTPDRAWSGPGPRPLVGYAVGTQGMADQCAPSLQLAAGSEYEGVFISKLLARGWAVAVTDYEGLGTPGVHTYLDRASQGHAVLDAVRAAQRLPEADLSDDGPVAVTGYSQGGAASASAGELAPAYAPELDVRGVVAGAIPSDLAAVGEQIDGTLWFSFLGYAVAGLRASYDLDLAPVLDADGLALIGELEQECVPESLLQHPFVRSEALTTDGRPLTDALDEAPFDTVIAEQRIGVDRSPAAPALVSHSVLDDIVPYPVGRGVARRWCDEGATVQLSTNAAAGHIGGLLAAYPAAFVFLEARFADLPAASSCWRL